MVEPFVRDVEPGDAEALAVNLRPADAAEIAACGLQGLEAIQGSIRASLWARTLVVDGAVAAIGGLAPMSLLGGIGSPWLLATPALSPRVLVRHAPGYIAEMHRTFPELRNFVHAENTRSIRWLRAAGFAILPAVPAVTGALFHPFVKRA